MDLSSLPNEILIVIFEHCKKLLPLTLVSKQFNELISNTPCLMRKFQLLINERTKSSEIIMSRRKHQRILIKFNYKIDNSILDVLKTFPDIKHLELMRCILKQQLFIQMMELLPNLETLSIYTTYLQNNYMLQEDETKPLECLKNLRALNFRNSDQKFLNLLKKSNSVKCLNISLPHQYPASLITNFLSDHSDAEVIENLMISEIEDTILVLILCSMRNLTTLALEIDKMVMDKIKNLDINNCTIECLNLYGSPLDPVDFNTVISFFRKIKNLEIEMNSVLEPINMVQLQRSASQIESLKIMNCYGDFFNHITLPNLRIFEIYDVASFTSQDWTNFGRRNKNIEILTIKDEAVTDEIFMTITQEFRNLKYLEVYYDPQRLTNDILDYICDNLFPRNIRTVKIRKRQWQQYSNSFFNLTIDHKDALNSNLGFNLILR